MRKSLIYIIIIAQAFFIIGLIRGLVSTYESRKRVDELSLRRENLLTQKNEIETKLSNLNDDYYLEKVAREQLNLAKEGEVVVMLESTQDDEQSDSKQNKHELKNYEKWWNVFFGDKIMIDQ